ncbi:unnamed protein product [Auanema sp. JU1783]|nr:unnamed protein product [Auanema sp. JU1783]
MTGNALSPTTSDLTNNNEAYKEIFHVPGFCTYCGQKEMEKQSEQTSNRKNDNGFYLNIIIGNSIDLRMNSSQRLNFKRDYENFKLRVTLINLVLLTITFFFPSRPMDAVCHFLMVWYYCTLTIRENILIINGSKIHWWWVAHHYLACVVGGVALTWPDDEAYHEFRPQFIMFTGYICLVQQLQYQYQNGCIRRLHALGHGDTMDITLEGFASWMFQGLTFLLPFLMLAYIFEIYNAYCLLTIWHRQQCVWQVLALAILFTVVGAGNIFFVTMVLARRMSDSAKCRIDAIIKKHPSLEKLLLEKKDE